jgi:hypothetical protein
MKPLSLLFALLFLSCDTPTDVSREEVISIGHLYTRQFYYSDLEALHRNFAEKSFTLQNLRDFRLQVENELGSEVEVYDEMIDTKIWKDKRYYGYVRHSKFSKTNLPVRTLFDFVSKGQYLGLCGNSGLSYAPHIHFHMQDSPVIFEGEGLPIRFRSFYSDSPYVGEGEPEWGNYVSRL